MRSKLFYISVLATAFFLDAVVIFVFTDAVLRVTLGLLFLLSIIWAADALGIADMISDLPRTKVRHRQYGALRSNVRVLLDVVRRMNWLAVDLERGIRSEDEVEEELDKAYTRMKGIVEEIRGVAGRASTDPEVSAQPDLMLDPDGPPQGIAASQEIPASPDKPHEKG
jgi:hypothetical protein